MHTMERPTQKSARQQQLASNTQAKQQPRDVIGSKQAQQTTTKTVAAQQQQQTCKSSKMKKKRTRKEHVASRRVYVSVSVRQTNYTQFQIVTRSIHWDKQSATRHRQSQCVWVKQQQCSCSAKLCEYKLKRTKKSRKTAKTLNKVQHKILTHYIYSCVRTRSVQHKSVTNTTPLLRQRPTLQQNKTQAYHIYTHLSIYIYIHIAARAADAGSDASSARRLRYYVNNETYGIGTQRRPIAICLCLFCSN